MGAELGENRNLGRSGSSRGLFFGKTSSGSYRSIPCSFLRGVFGDLAQGAVVYQLAIDEDVRRPLNQPLARIGGHNSGNLLPTLQIDRLR